MRNAESIRKSLLNAVEVLFVEESHFAARLVKVDETNRILCADVPLRVEKGSSSGGGRGITGHVKALFV